MGFFICKSDVEVKVISILIFWGIRWVYKQLADSDGSTVHKELDEDEIEYEYEDEDKPKAIPPIATMPIAKKVAHHTPQATSLVVVEKPRRSQSAAIKERKSSFGNKRKLFRNALLMNALMHRKDFIT
ncbi:MAG: hypothetical protein NMK33_03735 [Candidatus Cardinium sp.]|uniref:hypothetical protein n=1 Tax=Cardinium endosymbiont of Dermatophagoides farinae TaxID=2597823 RepID=UPI001183CC2E|nr:hypothetical protein [Cardinium endosymbiont of Dermatophagoides farinae]TSJ80564.1 hypothetical protein FPG78_00495 [Cardinium endosymbiont of Dermatophagoides farinae]UWW96543.1 MAG: hypothetical protein NMK33_03735 [Candidatus Cardinium sp.]